MPVEPCNGCSKCRTIPGSHKKVAPHDWRANYNRANGKLFRLRCERCLTRSPIANFSQDEIDAALAAGESKWR